MNTESKVISLFNARKKESTPVAIQPTATESLKPEFDDVIRQNEERKEKMRQERLKANQGVLKSYRIKN